jgi:hypothetical protein
VIFSFLGHSVLDQPVKVLKMVKHNQGSSKLGQGPTGPQNSPVTHPESLLSRKLCFEGLELVLGCLNLLFHQGLLLNELLNYFFSDNSFQALFYCGDHLFQLCALSFDLLKKCVGFILYRLKSLGHFHDFTLDGMDLLLNCALLL